MELSSSSSFSFIPLIISIVITLLCLFYLWEIARSYSKRKKYSLGTGIGTEGFTDGSSGISVKSDADCYDSFYCRAYDILVQPSARIGMEIKVPLEFIEKQKPDAKNLRIADIGCGTGNHVELFSKEDKVSSVIGIDRSPAMIAEARHRFPPQSEGISESKRSFIEGNAENQQILPNSSIDLLTMYYFTIYMIPDRTQLLKNIYSWLAPGGIFVCHIVNKLKFDPVLEAASPFVGFSVQKYATQNGGDRITKSEVAFEEFEYVGDFQLHGSRGLWEEEFRFKDGRIRRHEQRVWMPNIDVLVKEITDTGLRLVHHADMTPIGYEYQYLFFFQKDEGTI